MPKAHIINADVLDGLRDLETGAVQCIITSPPYWGLRDYGTASWVGGDPECSHAVRKNPRDTSTSGLGGGKNHNLNHEFEGYREVCQQCGAHRVDLQIGLEQSPEEFVERMVEVFREARRVLRDDGVLWLNLGDSYAGGGRNKGNSWDHTTEKQRSNMGSFTDPSPVPDGLKPKDRCMIPARVALALQSDGWWLRSEIIWHKPNPMPSSVTDRPTDAHEMVYLFTKSARYFWDQEAVREPHRDALGTARFGDNGGRSRKGYTPKTQGWSGGGMVTKHREYNPAGRNLRTVWTIPTQPYKEAHFATFPQKLVEPMVKAGTSEKGCCPKCGAPWKRVMEKTSEKDLRAKGSRFDKGKTGSRDGGDRTQAGDRFLNETRGWLPSCDCGGFPRDDPEVVARRIMSETGARPVPCVVLDPFCGAGTTGLVALKFGRDFIGIELNPEYAKMARDRIYNDAPLFNEVT